MCVLLKPVHKTLKKSIMSNAPNPMGEYQLGQQNFVLYRSFREREPFSDWMNQARVAPFNFDAHFK